MSLGPTEIAILLVLLIFMFGPRRIPEIGKSMGEAINSFRKATREEDKVLASKDETPPV